MGTKRMGWGILLATGLAGLASAARAQDWPVTPGGEVLINDNTGPLVDATAYNAADQAVLEANYLKASGTDNNNPNTLLISNAGIPGPDGGDNLPMILIGSRGILLEDGGKIDTESYWMNSVGDIRQTGGSMIMGGNLLTGVTDNQGAWDNLPSRVSGSYIMEGGYLELGGSLITGSMVVKGGDILSNTGAGIYSVGDLVLEGGNIAIVDTAHEQGSIVAGGVRQTGGRMELGESTILFTGVTASAGLFEGLVAGSPLADLTNFVGGSYAISGGDLTLKEDSSIYTGEFSFGGTGNLEWPGGAHIYASQGATVQSDNIYLKFRDSDPATTDWDTGSGFVTTDSAPVNLSGTIHFPDYSGPEWAGVEGRPFNFGISSEPHEYFNGVANIVGSGLTLTGGKKNDDFAAGLFFAGRIVLNPKAVLTMSPKNTDNMVIAGNLVFDQGSKLVIAGETGIASIDSPNGPFHSSFSTINRATAIVEFGRNGKFNFGSKFDMDSGVIAGGTFTLAGPTVFLLDYNRITDLNLDWQLNLDRGGKLADASNLTLGINPSSVPATVKAGDPAKPAILIGSDWSWDSGLLDADRVKKATDDLSIIDFKSSYQHGLYQITQVQLQTLDFEGRQSAFITGMVSKLTASGAMAPGLSSAGINPSSKLLNVFDNYALGKNSFMDKLYEGIGTDPASAYAGLAAGVNGDAVAGGASNAVAAWNAVKTNISGRMTGMVGGQGQSVAFNSFSDMAYAKLNDEGLNGWTPGFGMWVAPLYTHARGKDIDIEGIKGGYRTDMGGGTLGLDYTTPDSAFRFGVAGNLGGGHSGSRGNWLNGSNDFTFGGVELYAGVNKNNFLLSLNGGWSRNANKLKSPHFFNEKYDTDVWSLGASAEYQLELGNCFKLIPGLGVEYANVRQDAFTLRNIADGIAAFNNGKGSADVVNLPVSLRLNKGFELAKGVLTPEVNGAWIPSVKDKGLVYNTTISRTDMTVAATSPMLDRNTGQVGAGLKFDTDRYTVGAEYQYRFSRHYDSHSAGAVFRIKF